MSMTLEDHERVDDLVAAQASEISEAVNDLESARIAVEMMSGLVEAQAREIAALREVVSLLVEELDDPCRVNFQTPFSAVWLSEPLRQKARASLKGSPALEGWKRADQSAERMQHCEWIEPDPAEAIRAKCERKAWQIAGLADSEMDAAYNQGWRDGAERVAHFIAALKGNGERK